MILCEKCLQLVEDSVDKSAIGVLCSGCTQYQVNFIKKLELKYKITINNKVDFLKAVAQWDKDGRPTLKTAFPKPKKMKEKRVKKNQRLRKLA